MRHAQRENFFTNKEYIMFNKVMYSVRAIISHKIYETVNLFPYVYNLEYKLKYRNPPWYVYQRATPT